MNRGAQNSQEGASSRGELAQMVRTGFTSARLEWQAEPGARGANGQAEDPGLLQWEEGPQEDPAPPASPRLLPTTPLASDPLAASTRARAGQGAVGSSPTTEVSPEELLKTPDQARPGWLPGPPASHRGRLPAGSQPSLPARLFPVACGWGEVGAREGCGGRRGTRLAKGHNKRSVGAGQGWLLQHVSRRGLARASSRVAPITTQAWTAPA